MSKYTVAFLVPFLVVSITACGASFKKQVLNSVVDVALAACVAENSSEDMSLIKQVCGFGNDMEPVIRRLIEASKAGAEKASARAAAKMSVDAGVVDAGKDAK